MSKINAYYLAPYYYNKLSAHILQVEMSREEDGKNKVTCLQHFLMIWGMSMSVIKQLSHSILLKVYKLIHFCLWILHTLLAKLSSCTTQFQAIHVHVHVILL